METEKLLSVAQFAKATGHSKSWITILTDRRADRGGIMPVKIGGHIFIDTEIYPIKNFKKKNK